jgi:N-acetylglutamate synthase/N-acetylornithine aminotransferase
VNYLDNNENQYVVTDTSENSNNLKARLASKISESTFKLQTVDLDSSNSDVMLQIHSHLNIITI